MGPEHRAVNEVNADQARRWITQQLEALQQLRHSAFRDTAFKQWRDETHKMAQEIWPAEPGRAERFRRIPYAAPMARPTERQTREWYERGCAEARALLRLWLAEIKVKGIPEAPSSAGGRVSLRPSGKKRKVRLKDMLGLTDVGQPQTERPEGDSEDSPSMSEPAEAVEAAPRTASREQAADVLRLIIEEAVERARDELRAAHESIDGQTGPADQPEAAGPAPQPGDASPALMVAWLAVEIESLDVPPDHAERVRGELLALARHLEGGEVEWSLVQDVIRAVLPYPALARRLLPLITPRLEEAS